MIIDCGALEKVTYAGDIISNIIIVSSGHSHSIYILKVSRYECLFLRKYLAYNNKKSKKYAAN